MPCRKICFSVLAKAATTRESVAVQIGMSRGNFMDNVGQLELSLLCVFSGLKKC